MKALFGAAAVLTALGLPLSQAMADELVNEARPVTAAVQRVKLGGVVDLQVKQGATPGLVIYGDKGMVAKVITEQRGDTLNIDFESRKMHIEFGGSSKRHLRAELTLPAMTELVSNGVGSTEVSGFSGERLKLDLEGAGAIKVNTSYRKLDAHLGGVGSLTITNTATDTMNLSMQGAGAVTLNGSTRNLVGKLGGIGSLDAKKFEADSVDLDMSGLGSASVYAKSSASLNLSGLGSATVYGKPANRNTSARGLGSVSWQ
ncbi:GIN domain-containing protein [Massilia sp. TS11]|uniref:GIN domain-containing protein n=1 Tax=Massilia sp. TS11 TaxID=2908003 RepID=UPI001EDBAFF2|nr:DUF2807 domain-containing protein [Massilia sp. TS11]MCG2585818.1 DUF2807 domain-containing protein [Massilia sp. TS11]